MKKRYNEITIGEMYIVIARDCSEFVVTRCNPPGFSHEREELFEVVRPITTDEEFHAWYRAGSTRCVVVLTEDANFADPKSNVKAGIPALVTLCQDQQLDVTRRPPIRTRSWGWAGGAGIMVAGQLCRGLCVCPSYHDWRVIGVIDDSFDSLKLDKLVEETALAMDHIVDRIQKPLTFGELPIGAKFRFVRDLNARLCTKNGAGMYDSADGSCGSAGSVVKVILCDSPLTFGELPIGAKFKFAVGGRSHLTCIKTSDRRWTTGRGNPVHDAMAYTDDLVILCDEPSGEIMSMKTDNFWDRYEKVGNVANSVIARACVARKEMVEKIAEDLKHQLITAFAMKKATAISFTYTPPLSLDHNAELVREACDKLSNGWMMAELHGRNARVQGDGAPINEQFDDRYFVRAWISHEEHDKEMNAKKDEERKADEERHLAQLDAQKKKDARRQAWRKAGRVLLRLVSYVVTALGGAAFSSYASHICDMVLPLLY